MNFTQAYINVCASIPLACRGERSFLPQPTKLVPITVLIFFFFSLAYVPVVRMYILSFSKIHTKTIWSRYLSTIFSIRSCCYQYISFIVLTPLRNTFIFVNDQFHNPLFYSLFASQQYQFESLYNNIR